MIHARIQKAFPAGRESAAFRLNVDLRSTAATTVLFGPSGAGKTLTLECIAGFAQPDKGRILIGDKLLFDAESGLNLRPQKRNCGYVFQNYALFPHMTLRQNLEFAAERLPRLERHRSVGEMLEKFRLNEVAGRRPHEVSGGQKQRCSIARALIAAPDVLLLDEPARGLDAPLRTELYELLRGVHAEFDIPILLVSHSLEECFELADWMIVVDAGEIIQSGRPAEVVNTPADVRVATLLGVFNLLPAEIRLLDPGRNMSTLRVGDADVTVPYLPGHLKGDRVTVAVLPDQLRALPKDGRAAGNQMIADLVRAVERPQGMRLEFANGVFVDVKHSEYTPQKSRQWTIDFPAGSVRVL